MWTRCQIGTSESGFRQCLLIFIITILFNFGGSNVMGDCLGNKVKCFECNSFVDDYCSDPFNWSNPLPPIQVCEGCCVKIVQGMGTNLYSVRRTCTSEIRINHFMVDHVCMSESNRRGRLCFCEDDLCNSTPARLSAVSASTLFASCFVVHLIVHMLWPSPGKIFHP